ncbi:hypothetical protein GA0115235_1199168 [Streptomyces sp. DpondAA-F4a]|nr:hypothetical protein GA0115239_104543 [Streptomyces sp. BpilaLS-43]SCE45569.1 hypothetical protein GA0115235_1199168 [Streptomyces sp. DpondAA-F4a]
MRAARRRDARTDDGLWGRVSEVRPARPRPARIPEGRRTPVRVVGRSCVPDAACPPGGRRCFRNTSYGCWKPASARIFCASGVDSHVTNAAAASLCFEVFRVAAG